MKPHRISLIKSQADLLKTISQIHLDCHKLCKQAFNTYYPVAGNIGVFCHSNDEYEFLTELRKEITKDTDNPNQKYYPLIEPIIVASGEDVPEATYTYLYIRKPDLSPYGEYLGDVDFVLDEDEYKRVKDRLLKGEDIKGAKMYNRLDWDTIEISNPNVGSVAFLSTQAFAEKVRVKFD